MKIRLFASGSALGKPAPFIFHPVQLACGLDFLGLHP